MRLTDTWEKVPFQQIVDLYKSVGWTNYTDDPESLLKAFQNSTYVLLAFDSESCLVGISRSLSDDISIHYLQDILVKPNSQRSGVGRALLEKVLNRFDHVRTHMILTDDEEKQLNFYKSLGYSNTRELEEIPLNTFVKMKGIELK